MWPWGRWNPLLPLFRSISHKKHTKRHIYHLQTISDQMVKLPCGYRKNNIKAKFGVDIKDKTERELVTELGIAKIWDCGKVKWVWKKGG